MSNDHADLNQQPVAPADPMAEAVAEQAAADSPEAIAALEPQATAGVEIAEARRALEAALMAASEPMAINELKRLFDGELSGDILRNLLDELRDEWNGRSVELALVASGYRFRVKPEYQKYLDKLTNEKPLKYSRAVLETLAIIAYRQPVTRADIEDIRGVQVSPHILKTLQDRGWIDEIGHKEVVGRPALFATTRHFLDDLNLRSLEELPPLHELQATLDMTQAGAVLSGLGISESANANLALPGMENNEIIEPDAGQPVTEQLSVEGADVGSLDAEERHHG
ncbi:MAG: SMC-Scp complex subunit ScpB [Burkholderiales bacterium]|nr:SMC-Scp complex subunit ScpB [Burkholderiales bacterium]